MNIPRRALTTLLLALAITACDENVLIGPGNQLEVTNVADEFSFQLTALDNVTDSRGYMWENTGTQATIDVSQSITGGSALITVRDADGTVMYAVDAADDSDTTTDAGVAGTWSIDIDMVETSGEFVLRVQRTN
ncbi:MAG: hypothetical protein AAF389_10135 [Gemmatimonadota bacterium]